MCVGLLWGVSGRLLCLLLSLSLSFFRSDTEGDDSTVTRYTVTAIPVSGGTGESVVQGGGGGGGVWCDAVVANGGGWGGEGGWGRRKGVAGVVRAHRSRSKWLEMLHRLT